MEKQYRCIICNEMKKGTEEHIIPKSLGNETLKIFNVCKDCNSGLGTYVDNYLVNHMLIKLIRNDLGLKGQSGQIPNPFSTGKDTNGNLIRLDDKYVPSLVPNSYPIDKDKIRIIAGTVEEAHEIARKKLERMGFSGEKLDEQMQKIKQVSSENYQPEIKYDTTVDFNKFFLAALKIAYEYGCYKLGEKYINDKTANRIRDILYAATKGNFDDKYKDMGFMLEQLVEALKTEQKINCHMIFLHADCDNRLIVDVSLFMEGAFSFSICISHNADIYIKTQDVITEIIDIRK